MRKQGYEVFSVYEAMRGASDDEVLQKAYTENWILVTSDKDFGDKVYREKQLHRGIILLRLDDDRSQQKIVALQRVLSRYASRLPNNFVVVTEKTVRFARG